jgi:23S rRNA (guanosine2251-2'-O)-methyltransferase
MVGGAHAVREALRGSCRVERLFVEADAGGRARELVELARSSGISVSSVGPQECDRLTDVRCQGIAAEVLYAYADVDGLLGAEAGAIVFLDQIEDPQNLGAIIRTADAAGVLGVVIPGRRSAPVTAAVVRASAGAALHVPVCVVPNLARALSAAREAGFWLYGLDQDGDRVLPARAQGSKFGLVVGGEAEGLRRLVAEQCDFLVRLPMRGRVESLNASVAAGIAVYRLCAESLFDSSGPVDTRESD